MSSEINALPTHSQNLSCSWGKCCLAAVPPMRKHSPLTGRANWAGHFNIHVCDRISEQVSEHLDHLLPFFYGWHLSHPQEDCARGCRALWEERGSRDRAGTEGLGKGHLLTAICYAVRCWEHATLEWDLTQRLFPELLRSLKLSGTSSQDNVSPGVSLKLHISFCPSPASLQRRLDTVWCRWGTADNCCPGGSWTLSAKFAGYLGAERCHWNVSCYKGNNSARCAERDENEKAGAKIFCGG